MEKAEKDISDALTHIPRKYKMGAEQNSDVCFFSEINQNCAKKTKGMIVHSLNLRLILNKKLILHQPGMKDILRRI